MTKIGLAQRRVFRGRASLLYKVIFNDEDQRALKDFLADASGGSLKSDQIKFSFTEIQNMKCLMDY